MTVTTSELPPRFGEAGQAIEQLRISLEMGRAGGLKVQDPGMCTFAALRVTGPAGSVLVSAGHKGDNRVLFFAPPVHEVEVNGMCEVIGTPDRITEVAGILRRRVTVARTS